MPGMNEQIATDIPLLETKLFAPRWHADLISRPRLVERLRQGGKQKLVLISAPAGFGKSTLLAEWLMNGMSPTAGSAWISLDQSDNDPTLFWSYFLNGLRNISPEGCEQALSMLHSPQPVPIETILTTLINRISQIDSDAVVHLDDFHLITNPIITDAMSFLLTHMPANMRLFMATRSDPALPLSRLRGRGELLELRSADLRFTAEETSAFLRQSMGLELSAKQIEALESRTEGWIAGLQMAALSMQGRNDIDALVDAFAGDDRYIVDYLLQEVLQSQTAQVRQFLLQTAILDRLNGPLCEAVTGYADCQQLLQTLERSNLFIIPLDEKRQWYRYHHLFADMLATHLAEEQADQLPVLHLKASIWYENNGLTGKAIEHTLRAEDMERAATLIEPLWAKMDKSLQSASWLKWASQLPDQEVRQRPVINVGIAWALLDSGKLDNIESRLQEAEQMINSLNDAGDLKRRELLGIKVTDEKQFAYLPATIATARAYRAQAFGDTESTIRNTQIALDHLPEDDHTEYGAASALLGLAYWSSGDMNAAYRTFSEVLDRFAKTDSVLLAIGPLFVLADIKAAQGYLLQAVSQYRHSMDKIYALENITLPGTASLHLGLSAVLCERGDMEAARKELATCAGLDEQARLPGNKYRQFLTEALIKEASGNAQEALALLDAADRAFHNSPMPNLQPFGAMKARIWLSLDNLPEAMAWAREAEVDADDNLTYLREFEHVTLAKVLIARHRQNTGKGFAGQALALLERLLKPAEAQGRLRSSIDILITTALAHHVAGEINEALGSLGRALDLAAAEGYQRMFVSEGPAMQEVLRHAVGNGIGGDYARQLLAVFENGADNETTDGSTGLENPLTAREIEILCLIAAGMRNQEIADHLFISLYTVKRHIANAYGKLSVNHRTEAIARAKALNLL